MTLINQWAYLFNREGGVSFTQGTKQCWLSSGFTCTFSWCARPRSFHHRTLKTCVESPHSLSWTLSAARQSLPSWPAQTKEKEGGGGNEGVRRVSRCRAAKWQLGWGNVSSVSKKRKRYWCWYLINDNVTAPSLKSKWDWAELLPINQPVAAAAITLQLQTSQLMSYWKIQPLRNAIVILIKRPETRQSTSTKPDFTEWSVLLPVGAFCRWGLEVVCAKTVLISIWTRIMSPNKKIKPFYLIVCEVFVKISQLSNWPHFSTSVPSQTIFGWPCILLITCVSEWFSSLLPWNLTA